MTNSETYMVNHHLFFLMVVFILTMTSKVLDKGLTRVSGYWYGSVNRQQCSPGLLSFCSPLACDLSASAEKVLKMLF